MRLSPSGLLMAKMNGHEGNRLYTGRQKYSARPFYLTILCMVSILLISFALRSHERYGESSRLELLEQRGTSLHNLKEENLECILVHKAEDKCAFVKQNCADEEAGLFSYLGLYYCKSTHAKPLSLALMVTWLSLLFSTIGIAASDFFCPNLSTIAQLLGLSESLAGVTFLAFGNGSPDVFSTFAAFSTDSASLAVGELIGAAGFITAVVAGSMAITRPFKVARRSFVRDVVFFIIASGFSMVFLYDGKLYFWECCVMVGFYIFYVIAVVTWHWWLTRRKRKRQIEAAARAHYVTSGFEDVVPEERHQEEEDATDQAVTRRSTGLSQADFSALEQGNHSADLDEEEVEEEEAQIGLGQLRNRMRLSLRPQLGVRQTTRTSIRPSLVGALEFRAVLAGLQKSRNIQTMPLYLRRYSDDSAYDALRDGDRMSTISDPSVRHKRGLSVGDNARHLMPSRPDVDGRTASGNRARAVSANDAEGLHLDPSTLPKIDLLGPLPEDDSSSMRTRSQRDSVASIAPPSPTLLVSTSPSDTSSRSQSPAPQPRRFSQHLLVPPTTKSHIFADQGEPPHSIPQSAEISPRTRSPELQLPKLIIPSGTDDMAPTSPFPPYSDNPISAATSPRIAHGRGLPSVSAGSFGPSELYAGTATTRPSKWWPYSILPSPQELFSTLFPTLWSWENKTIWEKALGIVSAPSVFLLTLTLPVIESAVEESRSSTGNPFSMPPQVSISSADGLRRSQGQSVITIIEPPPSSPPDFTTSGVENGQTKANNGFGEHRPMGPVAAAQHNEYDQAYHSAPRILSPSTHPNHDILQSPEQLTAVGPDLDHVSDGWNRWLIMLQTVTAPTFIVLILWANLEADQPQAGRTLFKWLLYGFLSSCITLALILGLTTASQPPKWRKLLCFLGFVVSISWISTIANEVVGVLKAIGIILNISDAILGLTVFAVGNSLGDLVADITVARLGFPVMALSACFGGPMLNILLGIGVSGLYKTITGARARHERHPNKEMKYKPYHIEVSRTLVVSGMTLLVTLVGLLIAVPLRKWRMDRFIGIGLISLWCVSTVCNLGLELSGHGGSVA